MPHLLLGDSGECSWLRIFSDNAFPQDDLEASDWYKIIRFPWISCHRDSAFRNTFSCVAEYIFYLKICEREEMFPRTVSSECTINSAISENLDVNGQRSIWKVLPSRCLLYRCLIVAYGPNMPISWIVFIRVKQPLCPCPHSSWARCTWMGRWSRGSHVSSCTNMRRRGMFTNNCEENFDENLLTSLDFFPSCLGKAENQKKSPMPNSSSWVSLEHPRLPVWDPS